MPGEPSATPTSYYEETIYQGIERVSKERCRGIDTFHCVRQKSRNAGGQPVANPGKERWAYEILADSRNNCQGSWLP